MEFRDLQKQYGGEFVAILNDEKVVAHGKTFHEVVTRLDEMKLRDKTGVSIRFVRPLPQGLFTNPAGWVNTGGGGRMNENPS